MAILGGWGCHLEKKQEKGSRERRKEEGGSLFEGKETLMFAQCSRNLGEGSRCVHAADLLPTSPREAQGGPGSGGETGAGSGFQLLFNGWPQENRKRAFKAGSSQRQSLSEMVGVPLTLVGEGTPAGRNTNH